MNKKLEILEFHSTGDSAAMNIATTKKFLFVGVDNRLEKRSRTMQVIKSIQSDYAKDGYQTCCKFRDLVYVGTCEGYLRAYDINLNLAFEINAGEEIVDFDVKGKHIAICTKNMLRLYKDRELQSKRIGNYQRAVYYGEKLLACHNDDKKIGYVEIHSVSNIRTFKVSNKPIVAMAAGEGKIAVASNDSTIRVFDLSLNSVCSKRKVHDFVITFVDILNGQVISGSADGTVALTPIESPKRQRMLLLLLLTVALIFFYFLKLELKKN